MVFAPWERGGHAFSAEIIEWQLEHKERDGSRDAYNRAKYLAPRRAMMTWWGNHLDILRLRLDVAA